MRTICSVIVMTCVALATTLSFALVSDIEAERTARSVLARMTLEEKTMMTGGSGTMTLSSLPRLGLAREWTFADSSSTVRAKMARWDWSYCGTNDEATVLVSLSGLASTWNVDLARRHGEVLGEEARDKGVDQLLGPGLNLMRTPLCGRNWEYFGEDPLLAARLCVPLIRGVQSRDVAATAKHFILNDQELARESVDTHCDVRTLNEIYLMPFRAAIEEAGLLSVMTSYNRIDGVWSSENAWMLKDVLRGRLGFKGLLMTDWGGQHSTAFAAKNGGGLEMHWGQGIKYNYQAISNLFPLAEAVRCGEVAESVVDDMAYRTLYVMAKTGFLGGMERFVGSRNTKEHQAFAREEADEAIVLLKNSRRFLPLKESQIRRLAVVGLRADEKQCNKGCSAEGKPPYEITPFAGLKERFAAAEVNLYPLPIGPDAGAEEVAADISDAVRAGAHADMEKNGFAVVDEAKLRQALEAADAIVVFTGTELGWGVGRESEGGDRPTMKGRPGEDGAVRKVLDWVGEKTIVVVRCGSPVEYTWWDNADTVLNMSYLGQEAGHALADVISGDVNPSGKLPYTWPMRYADTAVAQCGDYNKTNVTYRERFYIGYRWFDKQRIEPQFPFGHGLSYTDFAYSNMKAIREPTGDITVSLEVVNVGSLAGKEVVQFYLSYPDAVVERCEKELKAFAKVSLEAGESRIVKARIRHRDLGYWDEDEGRFVIPSGRYVFVAASSSLDARESCELTLSSADESGRAHAVLSRKVVNAADYGFSVQASPKENAEALQRAMDGGNRRVLVTEPGTYRLGGPIWMDDNTELSCTNGVLFRKAADYPHMLINRGALSGATNVNITISGLSISDGGINTAPPPESELQGLWGLLSFWRVGDLHISNFTCTEFAAQQYCIQVVAFDGLKVEDFVIRGDKDGIHLNSGKNFIIRNGRLRTHDDGIAINAGEWPGFTPEMGSITDGLVENVVDEEGGACNFARIITGAWTDWHAGMRLQRADIFACGGRTYIVYPAPLGTNETISMTQPAHRSGLWKSPEGLNIIYLQPDLWRQANITNVTFRNCTLNEGSRGFFCHWENCEWARLMHPEVPISAYPKIDIRLENVRKTACGPLITGSASAHVVLDDCHAAGGVFADMCHDRTIPHPPVRTFVVNGRVQPVKTGALLLREE